MCSLHLQLSRLPHVLTAPDYLVHHLPAFLLSLRLTMHPTLL